MPRVSVNVGYFRNWWGNWYAVDNRSTESRRLHPVQHRGAGRCRGCRAAAATRRRSLQPRAGQGRAGRRARAAVEQLRRADRELAGRGRQRRRATANGLTIQGGTSTGRPALGRVRGARRQFRSRERAHRRGEYVDRRSGSVTNPYCRVVEPYPTRVQRARDLHDSRRSDVQVSGPGEHAGRSRWRRITR